MKREANVASGERVDDRLPAPIPGEKPNGVRAGMKSFLSVCTGLACLAHPNFKSLNRHYCQREITLITNSPGSTFNVSNKRPCYET